MSFVPIVKVSLSFSQDQRAPLPAIRGISLARFSSKLNQISIKSLLVERIEIVHDVFWLMRLEGTCPCGAKKVMRRRWIPHFVAIVSVAASMLAWVVTPTPSRRCHAFRVAVDRSRHRR
jgi:hypothetical protein